MKRAGKVVAWAVYRTAAKAKYVGRVEAKDEAEALAKAFEELQIPEHERFRIIVKRE